MRDLLNFFQVFALGYTSVAFVAYIGLLVGSQFMTAAARKEANIDYETIDDQSQIRLNKFDDMNSLELRVMYAQTGVGVALVVAAILAFLGLQ